MATHSVYSAWARKVWSLQGSYVCDSHSQELEQRHRQQKALEDAEARVHRVNLCKGWDKYRFWLLITPALSIAASDCPKSARTLSSESIHWLLTAWLLGAWRLGSMTCPS